jgi:hypothetical protein
MVMSQRKTIAVDLDATLAEYDQWQGVEHIGEPLEGAVEFVEALDRLGAVVIHTTRVRGDGNTPPEVAAQIVQDWLRKHGFRYTSIWVGVGKPIAAAYVDDRAVELPHNPNAREYKMALCSVHDLLQE